MLKSCLILMLMLSLIGAAPPTSAPVNLPAQYDGAVAELSKEFGDRLKRSRYMEAGKGRDVQLTDWQGFPTKRYTYSIKDKDGLVKTADVVMLNPSAEQIAQWIVFALVDVKGKYDPEEGRKLFKHILGQSGGQFPVAGVVYEDIIPADGKNEIYCFRDGVTVQIEGVPHRGVDPLTPDQIAASIDGKVTRVFTYARIQSTSPQMWIADGGSADVQKDGKPTEQWLKVVLGSYQQAWGSARNDLMIAWVKSNVK